jgi:two-component system, NarL family, invasion response regulator UvrY
VKIPVLILTLNEDENLIIKLFRSGVRGYLKKNCTASSLKEALEAIFNGGYYHNEFLAYSLKNNAAPDRKSEQEKILEQVTQREKEFLKLVCHEKEYTYEQIADQMNVQPRTVDGYRESIFEKFAIKSKTGLVLFILRHKLLDHL